MIELLLGGTERAQVAPVTGRSTLVADGQALVMALERPFESNTFDILRINLRRLFFFLERTLIE